MSDEPSTLLGTGESLNKGQAVDLLLNTNAPEEASEDAQEPVAEIEEVVETDEMEAASEDEFEVEDAEELPEADEEYEDDDEEYDVDVSEIEEVEDEIEYYTVKIDGEEKSVTADELVKSYQLEQAAQKRMQEAAEIRKNSEVEVAALAQQREQYAQALQSLQAQLDSAGEQPQEYWDNLYSEDPMEYMRQREAQRDRKDAMEKVKAEQTRIQEEQQQELMQQHQAHLAQQQEKLLEALPEWKDPEVAQKEKQEIVTYAQRVLGFSEQEVSNIADARGVLAIRKAYLYDELMAKKPVAQKKVKKAPKVTKSGKPTTKAQSNANRKKQALERLNKTGSKDAAVDVLLERMRS
ncbi:MAG: putative scaffolding protein [Prokaryotic dsDNA virus sp.]|jgi:hypothetical protein|nr:MAG: putative scaffolding protein [Prokaryotic dsDNA virus sp.]|tara:strand:- start:311 stop:1363 length:1053 start_codon:yes stop_codon:yes gene_type:complete